jgi:hypothetical protein
MKIKDEWTPRCYPSGGSRPNRDDIGRRTGNGRVASGRAPRKAHLFLLHMHALPLARTSARGSFVTTAQLIVTKSQPFASSPGEHGRSSQQDLRGREEGGVQGVLSDPSFSSSPSALSKQTLDLSLTPLNLTAFSVLCSAGFGCSATEFDSGDGK